MKIRDIQKTFDPISILGFKNLLVGGCSFTYNNSDHHACTWPYYLKDFGNFELVLDCSLPGAGNKHIHDSIIYSIEQYDIDPSDTLVVIMWAGNDRDDFVVDSSALNSYPFQFNYSDGVSAGLTGGAHKNNQGNTNAVLADAIKQVKSKKSRAVENYLCITGLYHYLTNCGFKFVFLEYRDFDLPATDINFDIRKSLPSKLVKKLNQMLTTPSENFYHYCLVNNLLEEDDYHPTPNGHRIWTKNILMPLLSKIV